MPATSNILKQIEANMVFIKGGSFLMNNRHEVKVQDFYLNRYLVTNADFLPFLQEKGNQEEGGRTWIKLEEDHKEVPCGIRFTGNDFELKGELANHPMVYINWYGVMAYCAWLSEQTGQTYRIPSEVEWEYAARGGIHRNSYRYAGSNKLKEVGWYDENSHSETKPVGQKLTNALKLHDMNGNVWEWCLDEWQRGVRKIPKDGSPAEGDKNRRVVRGGSWSNNNKNCTVSIRGRNYTFDRSNGISFRVCRY